MIRKLAFTFLMVILFGCTSAPEGVEPVNNFDLNRYLGKWHEIARLDHKFERGLEKVTAEYSLRSDGGVKVLNRGYSPKDNKWKQAEGRAYFAGNDDRGHLNVSFFGPFYSAYVIFELDREGYQYAFVSGYNRSYLWLLSRTPNVDGDIINRFLRRAEELGFNTGELIFVSQE